VVYEHLHPLSPLTLSVPGHLRPPRCLHHRRGLGPQPRESASHLRRGGPRLL